MPLWQPTASEASQRMAAGQLRSEACTQALLGRMDFERASAAGSGLPFGMQLVQRRYEHARLRQVAASVAAILQPDHEKDAPWN